MDAKLVIFKPNGQQKVFPLAKDVTVMGRGGDCDLRIPLEIVSRRHCEIHLDQDRLRVKDLNSSNGTYVNNQRVSETGLSPGDRLMVGPIIFTLQVDGVPKEILPVETRGRKLPTGDQPAEAEVEVLALAEGGEHDTLSAMAGGAQGGQGEEVDPISALEALASESKKKDQE
ncbi:MAG: FHA domain-containing protein [Phycisphaerae bacterium]|jgi:pSer/pThr/pTyr-binding forkhead associated (FHA) protein|nr:FHA domain-containing protein [Phycisphaerae bacterium]MDP7637128.1 FHA domain-containing protein [Phycisphaerae bacterium]